MEKNIEVRHHISNGMSGPSTTYFIKWDHSIDKKPREYFVAKSQSDKGFWGLEDPKILEDYLKNKLLEYNLSDPPSGVDQLGRFTTIYRGFPTDFFAIGINDNSGLIWKYTHSNIHAI